MTSSRQTLTGVVQQLPCQHIIHVFDSQGKSNDMLATVIAEMTRYKSWINNMQN